MKPKESKIKIFSDRFYNFKKGLYTHIISVKSQQWQQTKETTCEVSEIPQKINFFSNSNWGQLHPCIGYYLFEELTVQCHGSPWIKTHNVTDELISLTLNLWPVLRLISVNSVCWFCNNSIYHWVSRMTGRQCLNVRCSQGREHLKRLIWS